MRAPEQSVSRIGQRYRLILTRLPELHSEALRSSSRSTSADGRLDSPTDVSEVFVPLQGQGVINDVLVALETPFVVITACRSAARNTAGLIRCSWATPLQFVRINTQSHQRARIEHVEHR